jgi:protein MpaA
VILGRSVAGRAIEGERFAGARATSPLLLFGAIHGDEPGSAQLCMKFMAELGSMHLAHDVLVIPVANPDGLAELRKNNARDIDLNRNFDARNWQRQHSPGYDPGPAPLSEPETQILARVIDELDPRLIVSLHQPLRCVNWDGPAAELAQAMAQLSGYPALPSVGYPTPGSFGSRYGIDAGRMVITLELPRPVPDDDWPRLLEALRCATMSARGT